MTHRFYKLLPLFAKVGNLRGKAILFALFMPFSLSLYTMGKGDYLALLTGKQGHNVSFVLSARNKHAPFPPPQVVSSEKGFASFILLVYQCAKVNPVIKSLHEPLYKEGCGSAEPKRASLCTRLALPFTREACVIAAIGCHSTS